jgi:hypothetical protein
MFGHQVIERSTDDLRTVGARLRKPEEHPREQEQRAREGEVFKSDAQECHRECR